MLKDYKVEEVIDCYNKANKFLKGIELANKHHKPELIYGTIKTSVKIAYDIKKNQLLQVL